MSGKHVMASHEGAAVRVQLDAMINALNEFGDMAEKHGDAQVLVLVATLRDARTMAGHIENRSPERKGVRLAKA